MGLIPGLGGSPGEGNGNPFQYSCLENPMDRGAWQAIYCPWGYQGVGHDLETKQHGGHERATVWAPKWERQTGTFPLHRFVNSLCIYPSHPQLRARTTVGIPRAWAMAGVSDVSWINEWGCRTKVLKLQLGSEGLVKAQTAGYHPGVSGSVGLGWAWEHEFLTSSQVIQMLLAQGLNFENHCCRWSERAHSCWHN